MLSPPVLVSSGDSGFYDSSSQMNHLVFSLIAWQFPPAPLSHLCHVDRSVVFPPWVPPWTEALCSSLHPARDCLDSKSQCFCGLEERSRFLQCWLALLCLTLLSTRVARSPFIFGGRLLWLLCLPALSAFLGIAVYSWVRRMLPQLNSLP